MAPGQFDLARYYIQNSLLNTANINIAIMAHSSSSRVLSDFSVDSVCEYALSRSGANFMKALGPVSQDISEPDESEPFRFILALAAGYFGTIPINPDPSGRIFRNHQDISEPTIRSSALMNF